MKLSKETSNHFPFIEEPENFLNAIHAFTNQSKSNFSTL